MLWRFLVQILAGIRAVHSRGMACRVIDPTHILFTRCACRLVPRLLNLCMVIQRYASAHKLCWSDGRARV
jgi:hypothetical protein